MGVVECQAKSRRGGQVLVMDVLRILPCDIFVVSRVGRILIDLSTKSCKKLKQVMFYFCTVRLLGRNYEAIIKNWKLLTKEKGVDIVILDMPLLDTCAIKTSHWYAD